jgi:hypothetical protein
MSPETVQDMLARRGQPMLLRRIDNSQNPAVNIDVTVQGWVRAYMAQELIGGIIQGDRQVTISDAEIAAAAWPGPPKRDDRINIAGRFLNVQAVNTMFIGTAVAKHTLQVRG